MIRKRRYTPKVHDWVDARSKKPFEYDLVQMRHADGSVQVGWWNGSLWENRKGVEGNIVEWKRHDARFALEKE